MSRKHNSVFNHKGFTIVELLIVIVIIGILAAIVVVAYNGITKRASDSAVRSDLTQLAKKLEIYKASAGRYPINATELQAADIKVAKGNYKLTNSDGTPRNNLYYIVSSSASVDGVGRRYAVGTIPNSALTSTICLVDGNIVVSSLCSSGDGTRQLLYPAETASPFTSTSWASTGYSSTDGWATWVGS